MKIKIDKADIKFSQYIRLRDKKCVRCNFPIKLNDIGLPLNNQCSHYFGRGKEGTRFEPDNCDALCFGCHQEWGSNDRESYRQFKIKQLGEQRFKTLQLQAYSYHKKDRFIELIKWKAMLEKLIENLN